MPTWNRARFLPHALECFQSQSYHDRELIIIDDSDVPSPELFRGVPRVVYRHISERLTIGEKRNLAVSLATGEYFICWDDDDWSGPERIRRQLRPILDGECEATAIVTDCILDLENHRFWTKAPDSRDRLFTQGVGWGTLAWSRQSQGPKSNPVRFPSQSLAEDLAFRNELVRRGSRVRCLENAGCYVYVRHDRNTWQFALEDQLRRDRWMATEPPDWISRDSLSFYRELVSSRLAKSERPFVSCRTDGVRSSDPSNRDQTVSRCAPMSEI